MSLERDEAHLNAWQQREALAEQILPLCGTLYREHALVVAVFGTSLVQKGPIEIIRTFDEAQKIAGEHLSMTNAVTLLQTMHDMPLGRSRVDIGKLLVRFRKSGGSDLGSWAREALAPLAEAGKNLPSEAQDVVLYGFGRIGRLVARILINKTGGGDKYRLRAIVLRPSAKGDLQRRATLLALDSVHGPFGGAISVDEEHQQIIANGNTIQVIYASGPDQVDYTQYGIRNAIVIDNTGKWRDREGLGLHVKSAGASKVILTAPGKGTIPNIVYGVNHEGLDLSQSIYSAASCTTNAIVPVLKVLDDRWGIVRGHLETIHAYTNDQNLIDNFHKKDRRGRAAALNMVITTTGAATAAAKALPSLAGKLTGSAIRVPTPNVSLAILNLELGAETTRDELNEYMRQTAVDSPLQAQVGFSVNPDQVSSDLVGDHHAGTVDSKATIADGKRCVLYVWYDNEFGYSCQVVRLLQQISGTSPAHFPA